MYMCKCEINRQLSITNPLVTLGESQIGFTASTGRIEGGAVRVATRKTERRGLCSHARE